LEPYGYPNGNLTVIKLFRFDLCSNKALALFFAFLKYTVCIIYIKLTRTNITYLITCTNVLVIQLLKNM